MANKLNMMMAKTNQLSSRIVGMQIVNGNFIGIALSAFQMAAGFLTIGYPLYESHWIVGVAIGVVGVLLAILVERLSLGGLATVREIGIQKRQLEDGYYEIEVPTPQQTKRFESRHKEIKGEIRTGKIIGGAGLCLSAGLGDVFWHKLFEPLGWIGFAMSLACASVIGITFVHSELYKPLIDKVLKAILFDFGVMMASVGAERGNMQINVMVDAYDEVRKDEDARKPLKEKVKKAVVRQLGGFVDQVQEVGMQMDANAVEGSLSPARQPLALPAPRGKYGQHRDELRRLLAGNPGLSQRDVSKHFSVSSSTGNEWLKRVKAGQ